MNKDIVLFIDTSSNKEVEVGLTVNGKNDSIKQLLDKQKAQVVLPLIDQLLTKHNLTLHELTAIQVNSGPGSFTGLRVGVTIANTLGSFLKIPINHQPVGKIVEPKYS